MSAPCRRGCGKLKRGAAASRSLAASRPSDAARVVGFQPRDTAGCTRRASVPLDAPDKLADPPSQATGPRAASVSTSPRDCHRRSARDQVGTRLRFAARWVRTSTASPPGSAPAIQAAPGSRCEGDALGLRIVDADVATLRCRDQHARAVLIPLGWPPIGVRRGDSGPRPSSGNNSQHVCSARRAYRRRGVDRFPQPFVRDTIESAVVISPYSIAAARAAVQVRAAHAGQQRRKIADGRGRPRRRPGWMCRVRGPAGPRARFVYRCAESCGEPSV